MKIIIYISIYSKASKSNFRFYGGNGDFVVDWRYAMKGGFPQT